MENKFLVLLEKMDALFKDLKQFEEWTLENSFKKCGIDPTTTIKRERLMVKDSINYSLICYGREVKKIEEEFLAMSKELQLEIKDAKRIMKYEKFHNNDKHTGKNEMKDAKTDLRKLESRKEKLNSIITEIRFNKYNFRFNEIKEIKNANNGRWLTKHQGFRGTAAWEKK